MGNCIKFMKIARAAVRAQCFDLHHCWRHCSLWYRVGFSWLLICFWKAGLTGPFFPPWNQGFIDLFFYCQFAFRLKPTTASLEPCPSKKISCENENLNFKNFVWKTWKFTFFWFVSVGTFEPKYYLKFVCRALLCYGFVQCIKWSNRSSHSPL